MRQPVFKKIICTATLAAMLCLAAVPAHAASLIRDSEIEDTLKTFSRPIFEEAGLSPKAVRFYIVDNPDLNAFVAGGQNMFLHTGLMIETKNPEELIGVIAHEAGHIAGGHLFRTQEVLNDLSIQSMLATIFGAAAGAAARSGDAGIALGSAGNTILERIMLRHSRVQETAADQAGVRYLASAGLPMDGFLSFMEKLSAQELLPESQQVQYVRTHPLSRDRVDFLENALKSRGNAKGALPADWIERHRRLRAKLQGYINPDRAAAETGDDIAVRYGRAIALYRRGKMADALSALDALLKDEPQNPYFLELKAQVLFESGKIADSLPVYARAIDLMPSPALVRGAYGHALLEAANDDPKRIDAAIEQLNAAIADEPLEPGYRRWLGIAYGKAGKEGLSRLNMAEEAVLTGKNDFAQLQATLAQKALPKNSAAWLRADDILAEIARKKDKKKN